MTNIITNLIYVVLNAQVIHAPIIATNSVEVKTNLMESFNEPGRNNFNFYVWPGERIPRTEKWLTTEVVQEEKLTFIWKGKPREIVESTVIASNTVHLRIKQDWEPVK